MKTKWTLVLILILLFQNSWSQIRLNNSTPVKQKTDLQISRSHLMLNETLKVIVYLPKSIFSKNQINTILDPYNHLIEVSSQSILQKPNCTQGAIVNKTLSSCWIKNPDTNAKSVVAQSYTLAQDENPEYYCIETLINYNGLAPKTALVSVFLEKQFLQSLKSGLWNIDSKTICDFTIPENRWSEFVFQPNAGTRGFAIRGIAGESSICSLPAKTTLVNFWISQPN